MPAKKHEIGARRDGAASRKRLLDAAVECLIEAGVAGTTTSAVQRKAGASRGALLHHFPSHALLLAATVAELVERNEKAVLLSKVNTGGPKDSLDAAVRSLAFAARQPAYLAELELWAVARTNEALRRVLIAAERSAKREIDRVHSKLFAEWSDSEAYDRVVSLTHHFIHGLAISENISSSPRRRERLIATWVEAIRAMLEEGSQRKAIGKL